jgi:hypothetical protein
MEALWSFTMLDNNIEISFKNTGEYKSPDLFITIKCKKGTFQVYDNEEHDFDDDRIYLAYKSCISHYINLPERDDKILKESFNYLIKEILSKHCTDF